MSFTGHLTLPSKREESTDLRNPVCRYSLSKTEYASWNAWTKNNNTFKPHTLTVRLIRGMPMRCIERQVRTRSHLRNGKMALMPPAHCFA